MIIEYHRPSTISECLGLLSRKEPKTVPLAGGAYVSRHQHQDEDLALVDLQDLGLDKIFLSDTSAQIGATVLLSNLEENPKLSHLFHEVIRQESNHNQRHRASIAGTLVCADGHSSLACAFMALNAQLKWQPDNQIIPLEDYYARRGRGSDEVGLLISDILIPEMGELYYEDVGRSPRDRPLICVAVARWADGRKRICFGGDFQSPVIIPNTFDRDEVENTIENAYSHYSNPRNYYINTTLTIINRLNSNS